MTSAEPEQPLPLAGMQLVLVQEVDGRELGVASTRTLGDGRFSFGTVLPGVYRIRVEAPDGQVIELAPRPESPGAGWSDLRLLLPLPTTEETLAVTEGLDEMTELVAARGGPPGWSAGDTVFADLGRGDAPWRWEASPLVAATFLTALACGLVRENNPDRQRGPGATPRTARRL
jgi:hypothetical protein